jgi:hypothetical protein
MKILYSFLILGFVSSCCAADDSLDESEAAFKMARELGHTSKGYIVQDIKDPISENQKTQIKKNGKFLLDKQR